MKFLHGAIVENVVTNLFAKFNSDRLRNEEDLGLTKVTTKTTTITFVELECELNKYSTAANTAYVVGCLQPR